MKYVYAVIVPILLSIVVYYGFCTNYTRGTFNEQGFIEMYSSGVFQYRIIGNELLLKTYHLMPVIVQNFFLTIPIKLYEPDNPIFYASYFINNTVFLIISSVLLILLTGNITTWFISLCIITGSQFTVCPYDVLSYSILIASMFIIIKGLNGWFIPLVFLVIIGTLTRETSALILSFYAAWNYKKNILKLAILTGAFLVTYTYLRVTFPGEAVVAHSGLLIVRNLTTLYPLIGISFLVTGILLFSDWTKKSIAFIVFSLPYILFCLCFAQPWEIRLWVPIWIVLIVINNKFISKKRTI